MSRCHQRSAESIVFGAIQNGGLYVKLGQGLCALNHILPQEYVNTLRTLEDQALRRGYSEVSGAGRGSCGLLLLLLQTGILGVTRSPPLLGALPWVACPKEGGLSFRRKVTSLPFFH